jgi:hypothetical protein
MADRDQEALLRLVENPGVDVIPLKLRRSRQIAVACIALPWTSAALERFSDTSIRPTVEVRDSNISRALSGPDFLGM